MDFLFRSWTSDDLTDFRVGFLDLSDRSAGDDWAFVNRILAVSGTHGTSKANRLIIDSVAGFETLVGDTDAYGQKLTRRSRIAQMMRAARSGWQVVFVVEEPKEGEHHPEEFVTDAVVHLRRFGFGQKSRRTLEVEKARASSFSLGQHPFEIRDGFGTSTGAWENPDDPQTFARTILLRDNETHATAPRGPHGRSPFNAYVQVFPALQHFSKELARSLRGTEGGSALRTVGASQGAIDQSPESRVAAFGIPYLDEMVGSSGRDGERGTERTINGIKRCSISSLIGDEGTRKGEVVRTFLRQSFDSLVEPGPRGDSFREDLTKAWQAADRVILILKQASFASKTIEALRVDICEALPLRAAQSVRSLDLSEWTVLLEHLHTAVRTPASYPGRPNRPPLSHRIEWTLPPLLGAYDGSADLLIRNRFRLALAILRLTSEYPIVDPAVLITTEPATADALLGLHIGEPFSGEAAQSDVESSTPNRVDALWVVVKEILGIGDLPMSPTLVLEDGLKADLARFLEGYVVCRRVELNDASTPALFHTIVRCVEQAQRLIHGNPNRQVDRLAPPLNSSRIRLVVSDLSLFRQSFPDVKEDPLFLPSLALYLKRMRVTALLVDTDSGRPDQRPNAPQNAELRSLVQHQIYTWRVPFFGDNRVAIAVIPPVVSKFAGVVRELRWHERDGLTVDPHFELYSGIEKGEPVPVPLQVHLYAETPAFKEYVEGEQALFRRLFSGSPEAADSIIEVHDTSNYNALRDFCHLPIDTRLPFTLVFMIDGYWSLGAECSLRTLGEYMGDALDNHPASKDPLQLFRRTKYAALTGGTAASPMSRVHFFQQALRPSAKSPNDFLYVARITRRHPNITRVPFTWDFGFLLCRKEPWLRASTLEMKQPNGVPTTVGEVWSRLVRLEQVSVKADAKKPSDANASARTRVHSKDDDGKIRPTRETATSAATHCVSWREFFEAARLVAAVEGRRTGSRVPAFDLAAIGPDSLPSLILEIWTSEIFRKYENASRANRLRRSRDIAVDLAELSRWKLADTLGNKRLRFGLDTWLAPPSGSTLKDTFAKAAADTKRCRWAIDKTLLFPSHVLELYKTWLLLLEVLDFETLFEPDDPFSVITDRVPKPEAISARHWYKTACQSIGRRAGTNGSDTNAHALVPVRLPGHYTTRGDWFLGVAKGSRSSRLADRALDLLSSRRANLVRLQLGLGLPTRDVVEGDRALHCRTRLVIATETGLKEVTYGSLVAGLGGGSTNYAGETFPKFSKLGSDGPTVEGFARDADFFWLWRNAFRDYDRHSAAWRKWLNRVVRWTVEYRHRKRANWRGGFRYYDQMERGDFSEVSSLGSFQEFPELCDLLVAMLNQSSREDRDT